MKFFKAALPLLLALLIVSAGFFGSGAVSRFLPDYTGRVFSGVKEEGIQNAFFSGTGSDILVYPWNLFDQSACLTLIDAIQQNAVSEPCAAAGKALINFMEGPAGPFSRLDWETWILADPKSGLLYLPETEISDGVSVSMALSSRYLCYLHQKSRNDPVGGSPAENPGEKLRTYIEAARSNPEYSEASQAESSVPQGTPPPPPNPNPILDYLYGMQYFYGSFGYEFSEAEEACRVMSDLVQDAEYTTLSREGETLLAFSRNRRGGTDSLVLYYHESWDSITGFSLQLAE